VSDPELVKQVFAADEETLHFGERGPFGAILGPTRCWRSMAISMSSSASS